MVEMIERFGKVDEHCTHRLALINGTVPDVHHVHQRVCCRPFFESAVLASIEFITDSLQDPLPDERPNSFASVAVREIGRRSDFSERGGRTLGTGIMLASFHRGGINPSRMEALKIALPSNSSMDYYPQNTVAQYTTKLNGQIELDGEWEVGLAEISFPFDVDNVLEAECYFVVNNPEYDDSNLKNTLAAGDYNTFEKLSAGLHDARVLRIAHLTSPHRVLIRFSFDKVRNRVKMMARQSLCVTFIHALARILRFTHDRKIEYCLDDILAEWEMELFPPTIGSAYVYCDLVEHITVGDTKAPLLRIVKRMSDRGGHETFNPSLYILLQKRCFDTVEINLMTDTGLPIPFRFGKSFVVFGIPSGCL